MNLQAGLGGNSTASGATAGPGGTVTINSGTGGNGTNSANGGSAGSVIILGGSGGTSDSGIGGTGGSVIVEAGNGGGGNGSIAIGTQVTAPISIGRSTSTTTLNGNFAFGSGKGQHFNMQAAQSDTAGTITITSPATSASITFATPYSNPPACTITPTSNQIATIVSYWGHNVYVRCDGERADDTGQQHHVYVLVLRQSKLMRSFGTELVQTPLCCLCNRRAERTRRSNRIHNRGEQAIDDALRMGTISFDTVKHLLLCRIERRPGHG